MLPFLNLIKQSFSSLLGVPLFALFKLLSVVILMSFDGAKVRLFFHSRNTFRPLFAIKAPIVDIRHSTPTVVDIGQCESIYLNTETQRYRVYIISEDTERKLCDSVSLC